MILPDVLFLSNLMEFNVNLKLHFISSIESKLSFFNLFIWLSRNCFKTVFLKTSGVFGLKDRLRVKLQKKRKKILRKPFIFKKWSSFSYYRSSITFFYLFDIFISFDWHLQKNVIFCFGEKIQYLNQLN